MHPIDINMVKILKKLPPKGLVITYYGTGKGKTTAALGLALRASGYGKKVKIIQFIKGDWKTGEQSAVKALESVSIATMGSGFVGIQNDNKSFEEHKATTENAMAKAENDVEDRDLFVLVLDEILVAVDKGLIEKNRLVKLINKKPRGLNLVLTGRPTIKDIILKSDLVSEIKKIKHPFDSGVEAVRGIDF